MPEIEPSDSKELERGSHRDTTSRPVVDQSVATLLMKIGKLLLL